MKGEQETAPPSFLWWSANCDLTGHVDSCNLMRRAVSAQF